MAELQAKISAARRESEQLKESIARAEFGAHDSSLADELKSHPQEPVGLNLRLRRTLVGHFNKVFALSWLKDSQHVVSASQDSKLMLWNGLSGLKKLAIPLPTSWVMTCAVSPGSVLAASGGLNNICSVYHLDVATPSFRLARELAHHIGYVSCVRFVDDRQALTASGDATAALWDMETGKVVAQFLGHQSDVSSVCVSPHNPFMFVSGSCDSTCKLWDCRTGRAHKTFAVHNEDVNAVEMFPNGTAFASASDDQSCVLFDLRSFAELRKYEDKRFAPSPASSLAFSASGRFLLVAYDTLHCIAWDALSGSRVTSIEAHSMRVSCLGVSPDGKALCMGSWDKTLSIWA